MAATFRWWVGTGLAAFSLHAAAIRGTVVEDVSGRPLARATVTVAPAGGNSDFRGVDPETIAARQERNRSVRTNLSGIFEFASLPAGAYRVSAVKLEFVTVLYGQKRWYSPGMPIALEAGDEVSIAIRMPRFGAITGTVLDENDVGLPGHEVAVYSNTRPPRLLARSGTDDRGMYRLFNLRPGSYLVRSLAKQYEDESYLPTFYRDSPTVDPRYAVEVKLDEEVGHVDFHAATGRLFSVAGHVTGSGQPVVTLASDTGTETAAIDGNGNFSFNPMAPGTYELQAEIPSDRTRPRMASFQLLMVDRDLTNLRVTPGPLPDVQIVFEDTGGHSLNIPEGSLLARRKDPAGEGTAQQIPSVGPFLPGRWEVAFVRQPSYCVVGFQVPGQESVGEGRFDGWNEMLLAWDTTRNLAKFVLSQSCATVGGTVKNANGDGVAGIPVFVEPYDLDPHRRIEPALRVITDSKGRYSVSGLTPGVYRMLASFDYQMPDAAQMEAAQALKVTVDGGTHASLDLEEFVIR